MQETFLLDLKEVVNISYSFKYAELIAASYEPPFLSTFQTPIEFSHIVHKLPEYYLSPSNLLYPRCGHPTYHTMESSQTNSSVS